MSRLGTLVPSDGMSGGWHLGTASHCLGVAAPRGKERIRNVNSVGRQSYSMK